MPLLSIVPAKAVADATITDTQLRVLCAIGTYTNRLGGNVWASVNTLAKACHLSTRTIQRALPALLKAGYLRVVVRPGRTNLYEVVLDSPPSRETEGDDTGVTPPPSGESPKRSKERSSSTVVQRVKDWDVSPQLSAMWNDYPPRPEPYVWVAVRKAVVETMEKESVSADRLAHAVRRYAQHCHATGMDPRYVKGMVGFFRDGYWKAFDAVTVHGRTREEWARSGQDVEEFDRLAEGAA